MDKKHPERMVEEYFQRIGDARPNILWVVLDHVTFRHYKMTQGARPVLNTYERLAREGMEFTNCHSVHPLCLPARASMLTGMYANNHGKLDNEKYPDAGFPFFTDYLRKCGYRVGYFGKNHSGYENFLEKGIEGFYPESYGNPYQTQEYRDYLKKYGYGNPIFHQEWAMITGKTLHENGDFDLTDAPAFNIYAAGYLKNTGKVHEVDFLTKSALDWMDGPISENTPFAVRVDMWGPHHAYQVPEEFKDTIDPSQIQEYPTFREPPTQKAELVKSFQKRIGEKNPSKTWAEWQPLVQRAYEQYSYIDHAVGLMLDKLEEMGIAENTLVIYTADHGDALGSHGGLVDKAGDLMEEVMQIPMVVRGPGITAGVHCDALVSNLDVAPTVLEAAGLFPPAYMDGISMAPLLRGDYTFSREDLMSEHYGHFGINTPQRALYFKNYKYIATANDVHELYDLERDPFERKNIINDLETRAVVVEIRQRLLANMDKFGDNDADVQDIRRVVERKEE